MQGITCPDLYHSFLAQLAGRPTFWARLRMLVLRSLKCREGVEDVLQETWRRALCKPPLVASGRGPTERSVRAWIVTVACNAARDRRRRDRRERQNRQAAPAEPVDHRQEQAARRQEAERLRGLLHEFLGEPREGEPRTRRVLRRVCEGATNEQIAAELGTTVDAVKGYRHRAREQLRAWLVKRGEIEDDSP